MRIAWWFNPRRQKRRNPKKVKAEIRYRLRHEDYTCRIPKLSKPRIRYKLRKVAVIFPLVRGYVYK